MSPALNIIEYCLPTQTVARPSVAVIDNTFNSSHPAFIGSDGQSALKVFKAPGASTDRSALNDVPRPNPTTFVKDLDHGTHVAAIIGARQNSEMVGVYPAAPLWGVRAEDAILFFQDQSVRIVNISLGEQRQSSGADPQPLDGTEYLKGLISQNDFPLFIVAAGNDGTEVARKSLAALSYLDNVLVVAASTTPSDRQAPLHLLRAEGTGSNYGFNWVGIAAPGEKILSALYNGQYGMTDGTSQSTAYVSGVAAALLSVEPTWPAWQLKFRLIATADLWTDTDQYKNVLSGALDMRRVVLDTKVVVIEDEVKGVCKGQIDPNHLTRRLELKNPTRSIPLGTILRVRRHKTDPSMYTIIYYEEHETDENPERLNHYIKRRIIRAGDMRGNYSFNFQVTQPSSGTCTDGEVNFKGLIDFVNNFSLANDQ